MKNKNRFSQLTLLLLFFLGMIPLFLQLNAHRHGSGSCHRSKSKSSERKVWHAKHHKQKNCWKKNAHHQPCHINNKPMVTADGNIIFSNSHLPPTAKILWQALSPEEAYEQRHAHNHRFRMNAVETIRRLNPEKAQALHKLFILKYSIKRELKNINLTLEPQYRFSANTPYTQSFVREALNYGLEHTLYKGNLEEKMRHHFKSDVTLIQAKRYIHEVIKPAIKRILDEFSIPYDIKARSE